MAKQNSKRSKQSGKPGKRILAMTVGAFCLSGAVGGLYVVRQHQISKRYANLRQQGLAAWQAGNQSLAINDLVQYLHRYPNEPVALSAYGHARLAESNGNPAGVSDAIAAFRSLVKADPSRVDDGKLLLSLYLKGGYYNEALETADTILAHSGDNAEVVGERVQALMGLQRWDEAQQAARHWVELAPDDLDAQMSVLAIMRQHQQPPADIIAAGDNLMKQHPDDVRFRFLRGYAHALGNDPTTAKDDLRAVSAKLPVDDEHFAEAVVEQLDQLGLHDESLSVLVRMYDANHSATALDHLAKRYWDAGQAQELIQLLSKAAPSQVEGSNQLLALQSLALLQLKQPDQAAHSIELLRNRKADAVASAWVLVLDQMTHSGAPADSQKIIDACNAAITPSSDLPYLMFFQGDAYSRLDESELAIGAWSRAAQRERTWPVPLIRAAEALASEGRNPAALAAANEAVRRAPRNSAAVITLARVWATCVDQGQYGQSDQLLNLVTQIQTQIPNEEQTLPIRIKLLASTGRTAEAKTLLGNALESNARLSETTLLRLASLSDDWNLDLRQQCYDRIERQEGGMNPTLAYTQAVHLSSIGKPDAGLQLLKDAQAKADPNGTSLDWRMTQTRYLDQIHSPQALPEFVALSKAYPNDVRVQQVILASAAGWQDKDFMDQTIDRFRALTGERGALWRIARGRWILAFTNEPTKTQEAIGLLTTASQLAPDLADSHMLLARAQERAGKIDLALEQVGIASNLQPNSTTVSLYMVKLLQVNGNFEAARDRLDRVVAGALTDPEQRQQAALLLAQEGDFQQAIDLLQDSVDANKADPRAMLLLAQLYQQRHDLPKAEVICKKLMEKPDEATVMLMADVQANQGHIADANQTLKQLDTLHLEPGMREIALANFASHHLTPADASANFEAAVRAAPKNVATWLSLLEFKLIGGDVSGARQVLSDGLVQLPDNSVLQTLDRQWDLIKCVQTYPELRPSAVAYVRNPKEGSSPLEVLQAASADRDHPNSPQHLVDRIMAVARRYPQDATVQLLLSRMCLRAGRLEDAIAAARRAGELAPALPDGFELLAEANMRAGRWTEALDAATQWKARTDVQVAEADLALAQCNIELGNPNVALGELSPYTSDPSAPVYSKVLPTYARAKEMVQKSSAATLMAPLLTQGPQGRRQWIEFAISYLPDAEASAWLDRVAPNIPDAAYDEKLGLAEGWLRLAMRSRTDGDLQKAKSLLESIAAQAHPDTQSLLLLAMMQEQLHNPQAAEPLYRRILTIQPDSAIARNNLAMILCRSGQNLDEAAALVDAAMKAHPEMAALYDTAAAVQRAQKHYTDAIGNQESAVQMQPDNPAYRLHLAVCLADAGRPARAGEIVKDLEDHHSDLDRLTPEDQSQLSALKKQLADKNSSDNG